MVFRHNLFRPTHRPFDGIVYCIYEHELSDGSVTLRQSYSTKLDQQSLIDTFGGIPTFNTWLMPGTLDVAWSAGDTCPGGRYFTVGAPATGLCTSAPPAPIPPPSHDENCCDPVGDLANSQTWLHRATAVWVEELNAAGTELEGGWIIDDVENLGLIDFYDYQISGIKSSGPIPLSYIRYWVGGFCGKPRWYVPLSVDLSEVIPGVGHPLSMAWNLFGDEWPSCVLQALFVTGPLAEAPWEDPSSWPTLASSNPTYFGMPSTLYPWVDDEVMLKLDGSTQECVAEIERCTVVYQAVYDPAARSGLGGWQVAPVGDNGDAS